MFCKNCGNELSDISAVCIKCGVKKGIGNKYCYNCGNTINENCQFCLHCGISLINNADENNKSKVLAGILGIFFGFIGIHRFYLGYIEIGIVQVILYIFTCGLSSLWGFIEGILILCDTCITTDAKGNKLV